MDLRDRIFISARLKSNLNSEFSSYLLKTFKNYDKFIKSKLSLEEILSNLESNRYNSVQQLHTEINRYFNDLLRYIGPDTILGKATLTLKQSIIKDTSLNQGKNKKYRPCDFQKLMNRINEILGSVPNQYDDIKKSENQSTPKNEIKEVDLTQIEQFLQISQEDLRRVYSYLAGLKSDEDIVKVTDIISIFDPDYVYQGRASFFVHNLSPFTIILLQNHMSQAQ